jgi:hypothetical protein
MNIMRTFLSVVVAAVLAGVCGAPRPVAAHTIIASPPPASPLSSSRPAADNPNPPSATVKLIFIHHSTGENWLVDDNGGLGLTLRDNNYFVSDTNYGWGPGPAGGPIGDTTDIGHWWNWFRSDQRDIYMQALFGEYGQNSYYTRLDSDPDPARQNQVILFKSCFPNSNLGGNPSDPAPVGDNLLRGQDAYSEYHTVANAKGIYNDLLVYFAAHRDKLFVVIAAPPLRSADTSAAQAANARAFNTWLVNDWLAGYPYKNVAVYDFYNVLTSNGGNANLNDLGSAGGNHHRWRNGAVEHSQNLANNYSSYPSGDSHPSKAGNLKASGEFVQVLNVFYHRWIDDMPQANQKTYLPLVTKMQAVTVRPLPNSLASIQIFNDQLDSSSMSEAQFQFAATHYAGTQKMTRSDADHLRQYNPDFVILHYRLGLGLGYRGIQGSCSPSGDLLQVIEGDQWVQEWPASVQESWFYHWPEASTTRVLNCDWGWYLTDLDSSTWRTYWSAEVLRQIRANGDDGLFADSFSVPNYLGADRYTPALPDVDAPFESQWAIRLQNFTAFLQTGEMAPYYFIPNVGYWITGRDPTDYSAADGVMIEGFAEWGNASYFDTADWQLQMERILGLVAQDKAILAQQYVDAADVQERLFVLGSYLLIKGSHTYLNFDLGMEPEWFPEYGIAIGSPVGSTPASIATLWNAGWGVYARNYSNGQVLVNPTASSQTINLGQTRYRATPNGGGFIPADANVSAWTVNYTPVSSVTLAPDQAIILLNSVP